MIGLFQKRPHVHVGNDEECSCYHAILYTSSCRPSYVHSKMVVMLFYKINFTLSPSSIRLLALSSITLISLEVHVCSSVTSELRNLI